MKRKKAIFTVREMSLVGLFAAILSLCAWLSVPASVPFTLQTFGVCCAVRLLGGRQGACAVLVYLLLGAVGLPVFAGFTGGLGVLLGATGGYLLGFLLMALTAWGVGRLLGRGWVAGVAALTAGLLVCYAFGTGWFMWFYGRHTGPVGLGTALSWCVWPFVFPDLAKILLAMLVTERIKHAVRLPSADTGDLR